MLSNPDGTRDRDKGASEGAISAALVAAAVAGDDRAKEKLVLALIPRVRNTAHYLVRSPHDAEDLAQLGLAEVLRSLSGFRGEGGFAGWAHRVVVRTMWAEIGRMRAADLPAGDDLPEMVDPAPLPGALAQRRELRVRLARHLSTIKEERRIVLVLKLACGYSVPEIAEVTGAPAETVRTRLRVGKAELARKLARDPGLRDVMGDLS